MKEKQDLIKEAIRQLRRISNKYSRIEKLPIVVDDGVEVSTKEVHTIQAIGERQGMSVTDVATHFGVTKSAASQIVAKLTNKGFLEKMLAPHSNKEYQLSLSKLGWKAFRSHERFHGEDLANIIERLSTFPLQQIATLSVLLETIGAIMDERLDG